jgi:hypothetical protein
MWQSFPPPSLEKAGVEVPALETLLPLPLRAFTSPLLHPNLGRVDEFEVLPTKSMACGKIGFATNLRKINGLGLIRQHALGIRCDAKAVVGGKGEKGRREGHACTESLPPHRMPRGTSASVRVGPGRREQAGARTSTPPRSQWSHVPARARRIGAC